MDTSRRALLASAALAVPAVSLGSQLPAAAGPAPSTLAAFHSFMADRGFTAIPALPLCPAPARTDGYTYDEGMTRSDWRNRRYVVQPCARVDDIGERRRLGVLPMFTQGAFQTTPAKALPLTVAFLTEVIGLKVEDLSLTTIRGNPLLPFVGKAGLQPGQVELRDTAAAKRAGDGSGWFIDKTTGQGSPCMSIEYTRGPHTLEIAELGICRGLPGEPAHAVLGLERVRWAGTGEIEGWDDVLPRLLTYTRAARKHSGMALPAGYAAFKASR